MKNKLRGGNVSEWDMTALNVALAGLDSSPLRLKNMPDDDEYVGAKAAGTLTPDLMLPVVKAERNRVAHSADATCGVAQFERLAERARTYASVVFATDPVPWLNKLDAAERQSPDMSEAAIQRQLERCALERVAEERGAVEKMLQPGPQAMLRTQGILRQKRRERPDGSRDWCVAQQHCACAYARGRALFCRHTPCRVPAPATV